MKQGTNPMKQEKNISKNIYNTLNMFFLVSLDLSLVSLNFFYFFVCFIGFVSCFIEYCAQIDVHFGRFFQNRLLFHWIVSLDVSACGDHFERLFSKSALESAEFCTAFFCVWRTFCAFLSKSALESADFAWASESRKPRRDSCNLA